MIIIHITQRSGLFNDITIRGAHLRVPPACRLSHDGLVNLLSEVHVTRTACLQTQSTSMKKMPLYSIGKKTPEISIGSELLEESTHPAIFVERVPCELVQDDFLIPHKKTVPPIPRNRVDCCVTIVVRPILRIRIKMQEAVISQVCQINILMELLVDIGVCHIHGKDLIPSRPRTAEVLIDFPVLGIPPQMIGEKILCQSLRQVVQAKVQAVHIKMHERSMAGGLAHVTEGFLHPYIADVLRIIGTIATAPPAHQGPAIGKTGSKNQLVESAHWRILKQGIVE